MGELPARAPESESPALPAPGELLDGKYRLLRVVGEGGMGVVFEAMHEKIGQRVAIKVLQPSIAENADLVARFEREARAAGRLKGRNVARVIDVEAAPGKLPHMVMEFLEGHDLEAELGRHPDRRMPIGDAIDIVLQACRAIAEAHAAGIVHRDLKPSNLFLCRESGERVVKLLDFGVSKMEDEASRLTATQLVIGTVYYMSPEQVRSARQVDARTDIWALSVILYELLAGGPPFLGSTTSVAVSIVNDEPAPLSSLREVPPGLEAAILKGMAKRPDARFPDVTAFARAIAPFAPSGARASLLPMSDAAPVVVVASDPSGPAMGTARTLHQSAASSGVLPVVAARTDPDRDAKTRPSARPRPKRLAPRLAAGAAIAGVAALAFLVATRSPTAKPAPSIDRESVAAAAPPPAPPAPPSPRAIEPAPPSAAPAPPDPPAIASAPPPRASHAPKPLASVSAVARPATTASPKRPTKEKPPLVAPF